MIQDTNRGLRGTLICAGWIPQAGAGTLVESAVLRPMRM